jgi:hypothetical protein
MAGSAARSWGHRRRWFGFGVLLAAVAITVVVVAAQSRSKKSLPVFVVLTHATVHLHETDAVTVLNKSRYPADSSGYGCTPSVSPRTRANFNRPNAPFCAGGGPRIPPHSRARVAVSITPTAPGKYWVYFDYSWGPSDLTATAYTKLTVLGS